MSTSRVPAFTLALTAIAACLVGCASKASSSSGGAGSGVSAVDEGGDANDTEGAAESLSTTLIGGGSGSIGLASEGDLVTTKGGEAALHTASIGDAAKGFFQPAGCLTVTEAAADKKVTYAFNDCTGPHGLVHITGTVVVTYATPAANQLTLSYAASGLKINNATINWTATANVTANGMDRDMVWDGKFDGTTGHGRAISRTNHKDYTWTEGGDCLGVHGTSDGTVTGHELKTDVINFSVCKGSCPAAGSEIKVTDVSANKVYDLKWNGDTATYTGPAGNAITYTPLCAR